jgi:hypothetical protein
MVKQNGPELPQETLFDLPPDESEMTVPEPVLVTDPLQVRSFRTPDQDRESAAFADLGGGTSTTAAVDPPRLSSPSRPRHSHRGGKSYEGESGLQNTRMLGDALLAAEIADGFKPLRPSTEYLARKALLGKENLDRKK